MGIFGFGKDVKAAGEGVKEAVGAFDSLIDNAFTSKEELGELSNKAKEIKTKAEEMKQAFFSKIYELDMGSDSWMAKNIRPYSYAAAWIMVIFCSITDGNFLGITIKPDYVDLYENLLLTMTGFYFYSRFREKIEKVKAKKQEKK